MEFRQVGRLADFFQEKPRKIFVLLLLTTCFTASLWDRTPTDYRLPFFISTTCILFVMALFYQGD